MRTIDRILHEGTANDIGLPSAALQDILSKLARFGGVLDVTNVHRLVLHQAAEDKAQGNVATWNPAEQFPCVAPPRPHLWLEWDNGDGTHERTAALLWDATGAEDDMTKAAVDSAMSKLRLTPPRWVIQLMLFDDDRRRRVHGPNGVWTLALDGNGGIIGNHAEAIPPGAGSPDMSGIAAAGAIPLKAIALMHAKNVVQVPEPDMSPKLVRRHKQRTGRPPVRIGSLHLKLPRPAGAPRGSAAPTTSELVGSHMVDGHFAHYGDCCPGTHEPHGLLFGKYEGMYFVGGHLRGSDAAGTVVKPLRVVEIDDGPGEPDEQ